MQDPWKVYKKDHLSEEGDHVLIGFYDDDAVDPEESDTPAESFEKAVAQNLVYALADTDSGKVSLTEGDYIVFASYRSDPALFTVRLTKVDRPAYTAKGI